MSKNAKKSITIKKKSNLRKTDIETKISTLLERGRKEITSHKQLTKFPIGSLISYTNNDGVFKNGGFLYKFDKNGEWFVYITPDFETKIRVRYCNVKTMYVGDVFKVTSDIVSLSEPTTKPTNFPVKIGDRIIYYGKSTFLAKRFMHTDKFKRMIKWYDYFISDKNK